MTALALEALVLEHAATLQDAEAVPTAGGMELRIDGDAFAAITGVGVEFRLRPAVAAAALRTPDTARSGRGPGWVRFEPAVLSEFARDRAVAWLESAWRFADEGGAGEHDVDRAYGADEDEAEPRLLS